MSSQPLSCISYQLSVASQSQHLFSVTMQIPALPEDQLQLSLPAWIPGSYMIRDFAKNIITVEVTDHQGNQVNHSKTDKQTWVIDSKGKALQITYQIYAFDLSVRSAFLDDEFGFCNGTSVFLQVEGFNHLPCSVTINAPSDQPHWRIETTIAKSTDKQRYICENYAELIDHPIFMGRCITASFTAGGVEFVLLFSGTVPVDTARLTQDLIPICEHHLALFDTQTPIERYVFMTLVSDQGYGGLEHRSSTALLFPRFDLPLLGDTPKLTESYVNFLSLCSHELFHTWHVKRIKPDVMVTPDLQHEVYTNQLWIYEGITSFYDDVAVARAGAISPQRYCEIVGQNLTRLAQNKGRHKQSIATSSFEAWTKFYQQDASAINNIVSYYNKGGIVAMGLDLLLRRESQGQYNLDHLMKLLWQEYGVEELGTPDNVIQLLCERYFSIDVSDYLNAVVYGTQDVALHQWLPDIGVSLHTRPKQGLNDKGGTPPDPHGRHKHQFGALCKSAPLGVTITQVKEGLAADKAGLHVNDILIAINDFVATEAVIQRVLDTSVTDDVCLTVVRRGRLLTLTMPLLAPVEDVVYLQIDDPTLFANWLGVTSA